MKNVCNSQANCVRCYLFRTPSPFFCTKWFPWKKNSLQEYFLHPKTFKQQVDYKAFKSYSTIQAPGITMIQKRSKVVWAASAFSAASRQGGGQTARRLAASGQDANANSPWVGPAGSRNTSKNTTKNTSKYFTKNTSGNTTKNTSKYTTKNTSKNTT